MKNFQGPTEDDVMFKLRKAFESLVAGYKSFTDAEKKEVFFFLSKLKAV